MSNDTEVEHIGEIFHGKIVTSMMETCKDLLLDCIELSVLVLSARDFDDFLECCYLFPRLLKARFKHLYLILANGVLRFQGCILRYKVRRLCFIRRSDLKELFFC